MLWLIPIVAAAGLMVGGVIGALAMILMYAIKDLD